MVWIPDHNERLVNIENWDFLDYYSIEDNENNSEIVGFCFFLSDKFKNEYILGYVSQILVKDGSDEIVKISKGIYPYFENLEMFIYEYLIHKKGEGKEGDFDEYYEKTMKKIPKLIASNRFSNISIELARKE